MPRSSTVVASLSFPEKTEGKWTLVLLEKGTCCYRAGELFASSAFKISPTIIDAPSFGEAVKLAQAPAHILLLPHIHKIVGEVETDSKWESMGDFIFRLNNPPLYLAKNSDSSLTAPTAKGCCATIEPLKMLLNSTGDDIKDWMLTETTQQSARICASGESEFCITNEYGLNKYGLSIVQGLKRMEICWHPYKLSTSTPQ